MGSKILLSRNNNTILHSTVSRMRPASRLYESSTLYIRVCETTWPASVWANVHNFFQMKLPYAGNPPPRVDFVDPLSFQKKLFFKVVAGKHLNNICNFFPQSGLTLSKCQYFYCSFTISRRNCLRVIFLLYIYKDLNFLTTSLLRLFS